MQVAPRKAAISGLDAHTRAGSTPSLCVAPGEAPWEARDRLCRSNFPVWIVTR
jgi:hypothetical protein